MWNTRTILTFNFEQKSKRKKKTMATSKRTLVLSHILLVIIAMASASVFDQGILEEDDPTVLDEENQVRVLKMKKKKHKLLKSYIDLEQPV